MAVTAVATPFFLIGCGGHGRVVLDAARQAGMEVAGIVDPGHRIGETILDVPVIGGDAMIDALPQGSGWLNGVGANPSIVRRRSIFDQVSTRLCAAVLRHPDAIVGRECRIEPGAQIMAGVVIQVGTRIGMNVVVNTAASIDHDCQIGAHGFIGPGATLCGDVVVGDGSFIGAGATILPGVRIGSDVVVGAGSLVNRDVPDGTRIAGNPARAIG